MHGTCNGFDATLAQQLGTTTPLTAYMMYMRMMRDSKAMRSAVALASAVVLAVVLAALIVLK
jgi:hypothetical protein